MFKLTIECSKPIKALNITFDGDGEVMDVGADKPTSSPLPLPRNRDTVAEEQLPSVAPRKLSDAVLSDLPDNSETIQTPDLGYNISEREPEVEKGFADQQF